VDVDKGVAMVRWHAHGACLRDTPGQPASGRISHVSGMTAFTTGADGRICRAHCYRQPFAEELHALAAVQDEEFI
jgi:hypothetical protein